MLVSMLLAVNHLYCKNKKNNKEKVKVVQILLAL